MFEPTSREPAAAFLWTLVSICRPGVHQGNVESVVVDRREACFEHPSYIFRTDGTPKSIALKRLNKAGLGWTKRYLVFSGVRNVDKNKLWIELLPALTKALRSR
jgi:hypothetical protein